MKQASQRFVFAWLVPAALIPAANAQALDLTVTKVEVTQQIQVGETTLIAGRPTFVRATIGTGGQDVPGVDAVLHVFVEGFEVPGSPMFSINGPIQALPTPDPLEENDTINFFYLPPESADVELVVEVNPEGPGRLEETEYGNNTRSASGLMFECRRVVELVYVPVDYRPNGGGPNPPDPELIDANVGAGFIYGIFPLPDWNYHQAPVPDLLWEANINNSSAALLNQLSRIRTVILPEMGYPEPDYIFGWFPGNPCSCNGRANGIPGDAAFGNTQLIRHQRTFAHELGHLFGMSHVNRTINTIGIDVEHHLIETQGLPRIKAPGLRTIMVPGLLTNQAWIDSLDYEFVAGREIVSCEEPPPGPAGGRLLHITGVVDNATGRVSLDPIFEVPGRRPTRSTGEGNLLIEAYGAAGQGSPLLHRLTVDTQTADDRCDAANEQFEKSPLNVLMPVAGGEKRTPVDRIVVRDAKTGEILTQRLRSPNAPIVAIDSPRAGDVVRGRARIEWSALDADGDDLTYIVMYSHNGSRSWYPLSVNLGNTFFEFDTSWIAGSKRGKGLIRILATDGMNTTLTEVDMLTLGAAGPPHAEIVFPNDGSEHLTLAPVFLHGAAWDAEDLVIPDDDLLWSSDVDGVFATGRLVMFNGLSVGGHVITMTATDSDQMSDSDSVSVTVLARDTLQEDCNDNGIGDIDEILMGLAEDCNDNLVPDECDIADGHSFDFNNNEIPDECEGLGDMDLDGDLDTFDFEAFLACATGPGGKVQPGCERADIDADLDADFTDYGYFALLFTGDCSVLIVDQPDDTFACPGDQAVFEVEIAGADATYQWRHEGVGIPGANGPTLIIDPVTRNSQGRYTVAVTSVCGSGLSDAAELQLPDLPVIITPPEHTEACPDGPSSLSVEASGFEPLAYQWLLDGEEVPGANEAKYMIESTQPEDLGLYRCMVTDACGQEATSDEAQLTFYVETEILDQPVGGEPCVGSEFIVFVIAGGAESFQWYKDGIAIEGETEFFLRITDATPEDSGVYFVDAIGPCTTIRSDDAVINVINCPP